MIRFFPATFAISAIFAVSHGCASRPKGEWHGPARAASVEVSPWVSREAPASVLKSPRYWVYTTLPAGPQRDALPQVLEGAYAQYQFVAPGGMIDRRPMHAYVFNTRDEWVAFTARKTGGDAEMYKHITRGGYTVDDWFAVFAMEDTAGGNATLSAVAHEGFHQYAARHMKGRLPPFLEEGLACLFEDVRLDEAGLPRWNLSANPGRAYALSKAAKAGQLLPLEKLIGMHAGDVVRLSDETKGAFYAQNWAFARFLLEAEGGKYRPALNRLVADTVAGSAFDPTGTLRSPRRAWDPSGTRATLEHYLGEDLASIDRAYTAFVSRITGEPLDRSR